VSDTGLSGVVTDTLNDEATYVASSTIYDSLGRVRQTQTTAAVESGGRIVDDTLYDSHGWAEQTSSNWDDPSSMPVLALANTPWNDNSLPDEDLFTYDGAGRQVEDTSVSNDKAIATTVTVYNGDSTTTIPGIPAAEVATGTVPAIAGTIEKTAVNPIGQTASLTEYTANPTLTIPSSTFTGTFSISGGTQQAITYAYNAAGTQDKESLGGANWTQAYNLLGQETSTTDPAGGTTTMAYDADGDLTQTQDAAGNYTSYTYDQDGRKTAEYAAASTAQVPFGSTGANETGSWVYDNANSAFPSTLMTNPVGQETTEDFYSGAYDYRIQQVGFNAFGESKEEIFSLPSGSPAAGLGSAFIFTNSYGNINGNLTQQGFPSGGGLPTETDKYTEYGYLDLPSGVGSYAQSATYNGLSQLQVVTIGAGTSTASVTDGYDPRTGNLISQIVARSTSPTAVDNTGYTYSPAGALTAETDEQNGSASQEETQCFAYTTNGQLAQAWTATDACNAVPTTSSHSTVGDPLGTSSEYDEAWTYNALGEASSKTALDTATGTYSSTAYGYSTTAPTELTSATTTGATSSSYSYGYNADGEQVTRNAASGNQTLAWNGQGELTGADVTSSGASVGSYFYDPEGNLFAQTDSSGTTIYLPDEQLTINGSTVSGVRFYSLPGGITAVRTGPNNDYGFEIASDQHGTNTLYLDYTAQNPARRQFDPYGSPRGAAPASGTFPGSRGFLNDPVEAGTGLTDIGARWYDPSTGTFASLDPLLETGSPGQMNGYTYASANPVGGSDPTGLSQIGAPPNPCGDDATGCNPSSGGGNLNTVVKADGGSYGTTYNDPYGQNPGTAPTSDASPAPSSGQGYQSCERFGTCYTGSAPVPSLQGGWTDFGAGTGSFAISSYCGGPVGFLCGVASLLGFDPGTEYQSWIAGQGLPTGGDSTYALGEYLPPLLMAPFIPEAGGAGEAATAAEDAGDTTAAFRGAQDAPGGRSGPSVSINQLKMALGRAGMSIRDYDLTYSPDIVGAGGEPVYGSSSFTGDGPVLGPRGLPEINMSDLGLSNMNDAVATVFHEIYHIESFASFGNPGTEAAAEAYGQKMLARYLAAVGS